MEEEYSFISRVNFYKITSEYLENVKGRDKRLIDKKQYDEIKSVLLSESVNNDYSFRNWCNNNFVLLNSKNDHILCRKLSNKTQNVMIKEGKSPDPLPVLILEEMYQVFCQEHINSIHARQKTLYNKLRSKWSRVKKKLVEEFVNNCEICVPRRASSKSSLVARPIVANKFLSRVQVIFIYFV